MPIHQFNAAGPERVVFGPGAFDSLEREVMQLGARRVFVIASATLAERMGLLPLLQRMLGERLAGSRVRADHAVRRGVHGPRRRPGPGAQRQRIVAEALGNADADAARLIERLLDDLQLPRRLRDVGLPRRRLPEVAQAAMHDRWIHTNPRRIDGAAEVLALLESCW